MAKEKKIDYVQKVLDDSKGKFTHVCVIGVTEKGVPDIIASSTSYPFLQWLLARASFELFFYEKNEEMKRLNPEAPLENGD